MTTTTAAVQLLPQLSKSIMTMMMMMMTMVMITRCR